MQTITIDIINDKVIRILHDLEQLQLIRLRREKPKTGNISYWTTKYKGAMQKQPLVEIENQLNNLRNAWE